MAKSPIFRKQLVFKKQAVFENKLFFLAKKVNGPYMNSEKEGEKEGAECGIDKNRGSGIEKKCCLEH